MSLAEQCFLNEYVYIQTKNEVDQVKIIQADLERKTWPTKGKNTKEINQKSLKIREIWLKVLPEGGLGVPSDQNWLQEGPRQGQGGTKGSQDGPKEVKRGAQMVPRGPKED